MINKQDYNLLTQASMSLIFRILTLEIPNTRPKILNEEHR